jgi:hypothetical protein
VTLDEWHEVLATEPATPNQVGRIRAEFGRLGLTDRAGRLAITAALAGLDDLGSTRDLTLGQAGRLCGMLPHVASRGELLAAAGLGSEGHAPEAAEQPAVTLIEVIRDLIVQIYAAQRADSAGRESPPFFGAPSPPHQTALFVPNNRRSERGKNDVPSPESQQARPVRP